MLCRLHLNHLLLWLLLSGRQLWLEPTSRCLVGGQLEELCRADCEPCLLVVLKWHAGKLLGHVESLGLGSSHARGHVRLHVQEQLGLGRAAACDTAGTWQCLAGRIGEKTDRMPLGIGPQVGRACVQGLYTAQSSSNGGQTEPAGSQGDFFYARCMGSMDPS